MNRYITGINRFQVSMPTCIDELVSENNEVRVIDAFVNSLDLVALGFDKAVSKQLGTPAYNPADLLKIFIYCYPKKIRSSRNIEAEVKRNLELIWLVNNIKPNFRTLSDFRKNNIVPITKVLKEFNKLCIDLKVFSNELASLDGSKFKAVNSKDKLVDRIDRLNKQVDEYMKALETADKDSPTYTQDTNDICDKLVSAQERAVKYNQYLTNLTNSGENQLSLTDAESRLMKCNGNMLVGFNAQVVTNTDSHIITDISVSNKPNDNGSMFEMGQKAKKSLNTDQLEQLADGGYVDNDDIKKCFENKIVPILPEGEYEIVYDYKEHSIDDKVKKGDNSEDIIKCFESGIIPDCYSHLNMNAQIIDIEQEINEAAIINADIKTLRNKAKEGFFVRDKVNNVVYCPCDNILNFKRKKNTSDLFIGNSKCLTCKDKCTKKVIREVEIPFNVDICACKAFGSIVPKKIVKKNLKKVIIKYRPDKDKYKLRKCTSEHPFGTLKRHHDASYFLLKGIDKVTAELTLSVLGYNFKRLINIKGIKEIINHLNSEDNRSFSFIFHKFSFIFLKYI